MDVIEQVRSFGKGAEPLTDDAVGRSRTNLLQAVAATRPHSRRVPRARKALIPAALVGGIAVAAGAVSIVIPAAPNAAAADVLRGTAALSDSASEIEIPAGQYLKVESTSTILTLWDADMSVDWARFNNGDPRAAEAGFDVQSTRTMYVPANRDDDWVVVDSRHVIINEFGSYLDEARADWNHFSVGSDSETDVCPGGELLTVEGGQSTFLDRRTEYAEMPRDPEKLLSWWRERSGLTGKEADRWVVSGITEDLSVNLAPAELRAAMFEALSLLPDIRIVDTSGSDTTLSFSWHMNDRVFETLVKVDTERGLLTSVHELQSMPIVTIFGSPILLSSLAVSTQVVDTAPSQ